jgi:hypothetical protein
MGQSQFNPIAIKERLLGPIGYEWSLADDFAEAEAVGGLGSSAESKLRTAIKCLLVGFDEPAVRLLKLALEWVEVAIASDERPERYFPNGTEALFFQTKALCNWLLLNWHDAESFHHYVVHEDRYLADPRASRDKAEVSFVLPTYVDAGAFERALEIFGHVPRLSPPTSSIVRGEAAMAYVVSQHRLGLQYSHAEFEAIAGRFLKMHVDNWLVSGHWDTAAEWMKIIHWNNAKPPISAKQALLKCYDYLPSREPPA